MRGEPGRNGKGTQSRQGTQNAVKSSVHPPPIGGGHHKQRPATKDQDLQGPTDATMQQHHRPLEPPHGAGAPLTSAEFKLRLEPILPGVTARGGKSLCLKCTNTPLGEGVGCMQVCAWHTPQGQILLFQPQFTAVSHLQCLHCSGPSKATRDCSQHHVG